MYELKVDKKIPIRRMMVVFGNLQDESFEQYDLFTNIDKINKAVNEINRRINQELYVSLNDLYEELGLEGTTLGGVLGWNSNDGLLEVHFSSHLASDGVPCLALDFNNLPKYDYDRFM